MIYLLDVWQACCLKMRESLHQDYKSYEKYKRKKWIDSTLYCLVRQVFEYMCHLLMHKYGFNMIFFEMFTLVTLHVYQKLRDPGSFLP